MLTESLLHIDVANDVTTCVIVEQAIEADTLHTGDEATCRCERLQSATSADAYHRECAVLVFFLTRVIVDVGEGIKFINNDIYIVTADTMTLAGDTLAFIHASDGMELTTADFALFRVEVGCNGIYSSRITYENYFVGQLLWLQMQVEARAIGIND